MFAGTGFREVQGLEGPSYKYVEDDHNRQARRIRRFRGRTWACPPSAHAAWLTHTQTHTRDRREARAGLLRGRVDHRDAIVLSSRRGRGPLRVLLAGGSITCHCCTSHSCWRVLPRWERLGAALSPRSLGRMQWQVWICGASWAAVSGWSSSHYWIIQGCTAATADGALRCRVSALALFRHLEFIFTPLSGSVAQ